MRRGGKLAEGREDGAVSAVAEQERTARELLENATADPGMFLRFLRIKPKTGGLEDFTPNQPQQKVLAAFVDEWRRTGRVRLIILKPRQPGMSTLCQALMFWRCSRNPGQHGLVVAQDDATTKRLFAIMHTFYNTMPALLQPSKRVSNERALIFEEPDNLRAARGPGLMSRIDVQTAGNLTAGTGLTTQFLQVSELAKWAKPEETMLSLMQSVPDADGSVIIIESTAKGFGNYFHRLWEESYYKQNSGYTAVFVSVLDCDEYERAPDRGFEPTDYDDETFGNERAMQEADARWTDRKLAWRRQVILTKCNRDPREFAQEYPATPEEAFLTSGRCFFVTEMLARLAAGCKQPVWKGDILSAAENNGVAGLKERTNGSLYIWEQPQPGVRYVMGVDTSLGLEIGARGETDYSVAVLIRLDNGLHVATYCLKQDPDLFGLSLATLGRHYNNAYIVPEIDQSGLTVIRALVKQARYFHVYMRHILDQKRDVERTQLGWSTTSRTRRPMLDKLNEALRDGVVRLQDARIIQECMSFQVSPSGRPEAERGAHDDMVFATGLAVMGLEFAPHAPLSGYQEQEYVPVISELTGY